MNTLRQTIGFADIADKEQRDIASKAFLADIAPNDVALIHHKSIKAGEIMLFKRHFDRFQKTFEKAKVIVELGGGSGWASYYVKSRVPAAEVYTTDIAADVVDKNKEWASFFNTEISGAYCAKSYALPFDDSTVDLCFCFQAAHHFGKHRSTLLELKRILKPGGIALYLDEPTCGNLFYKPYFKHVNKRLLDDGVPEDVLVHSELMRLAASLGFAADMTFDSHTINRVGFKTLYFMTLSKLDFLNKFLPTTACFRFVKM